MHSRASFAPRRRALLVTTAASIAAPLALGQSGRAAVKPVTVAQVVDTSAAQQDVAKDFLVGSRAYWQDLKARGGMRGRPVHHLVLEVDGTPASLRSAVAQVRDNPACVALSGTAGDPVTVALARLLRQENVAIAHAAPWLQDSTLEMDDRTFPIFAARQEQIGHALKSLTSVGVRDVGAVFATEADHALYRADVERIAAALALRLVAYRGDGALSRLPQTFTPDTPAILLFVGGTPELAQGLPVVRAYRETLARLFDEPAAPLSLAGFIAARYTADVLADVAGDLTRQAALAAFQRRAERDLGGFRVSYDQRRRSGTFVTQSLLMPDGRVVG